MASALQCRSCAAAIPAEDVNIQLALAKCRACNAVFSFAGDAAAATAAPARRPVASMPKRFAVDEGADGFGVRWRWFTAAHLFLLFFCIAWDGFLVFWYAIAFSDAGAPWIMKLFPIVHVAVGVGLTYYVFCGLLNSTQVRAGNGRLSIRHGPLPWRGNRDLEDVRQLFVRERTHRGKHGSTSTSYELHAETDAGTLKLLSGLDEPGQALWLEQALERHLRIADRRVAGDYVG